jgi:universal stress protein A
MDRIKKILAPTDLSDLSQAGVRYALELAKAVGAEVTVYHVVCRDEFMRYELLHVRPLLMDNLLQKYRRQLSGFIEERFADLLPSIALRQEVELGVPEDNIVTKAKEEAMNLIVISTHGRTGLSHMFMGSVTEHVIRHAPCPVLSIRSETAEKQNNEAAASMETSP